MLLIDGVKYDLWTPKEEKQLEEMVKEHSKEIFGKDSIYFDLKQKLTSKAGVEEIAKCYVVNYDGKMLISGSTLICREGQREVNVMREFMISALCDELTISKNEIEKRVVDDTKPRSDRYIAGL